MCEVYLEKKENHLLVTLHGELILGCSSEMKDKVKHYAESNSLYKMIIDCSDVGFIDSSGLGALIAWFKMANQQQGKVVFLGFTDHVKRVVCFAKLDKIFTIAQSLEEAEALIKNL